MIATASSLTLSPEPTEPAPDERFAFVHSRDNAMHGVYVYVSLYAGQLSGSDRTDLFGTRRVYNFKRYGKSHEWVSRAVEQAKSDYGCDSVVVVPGSTPEVTQLQALFGVSIRRTAAVPRRKYDHRHRLLPGYGQTVQFPPDLRGRVLLVDDVCTSGETLRWFGSSLTQRGCQVVLFCLGLNRKLIHPRTTASPTQFEFLDGWRSVCYPAARRSELKAPS